MYKLLLSMRYLRTRYIALASIISVTLGVATMIIVNSVMSGFQNEMYIRLHGILSDLVVEAHSLEGISDPDRIMAEIQDVLGSDLAAMTPNVHIPAMISFQIRNQSITKQVNVIGVDRNSYANVSDFAKYLLHSSNREHVSFELREDGYDSRLGIAGWTHRRNRIAIERAYQEQLEMLHQRSEQANPVSPPAAAATDDMAASEVQDSIQTVTDPFIGTDESQPELFDPMQKQSAGIVLGIAISSIRQRNADGEIVDYFLCRPGDDVKLSLPTSGTPPKIVSDTFTVVDLYESKMSEYDSSFAFVPIEELQRMRGMIDPQTGLRAITAIQIKLADGVDLEAACQRLQTRFHSHGLLYRVQSWKDMQGPLLAAVRMETTLLNILLFLIIAVAGFGILATFFMIVVEKTRDIGILKSLGASSQGVMSIFVSYGLSLGMVGAGVGMGLGLLFVARINEIAAVLEKIRGRELFDPSVYYFQSIPTIVDPFTIAWIVIGAIGIAVLASILPAVRLHGSTQ